MNRSPAGIRGVDIAFAALALFCCAVISDVRPLLGKVMVGCWAAACVAGIVLRWSWLLPTTLGTFFAVQISQPFLEGYSHGPEENVWHDFIYPVICAAIAAAIQIGFSLLARPIDDDEGDDRGLIDRGRSPENGPHPLPPGPD